MRLLQQKRRGFDQEKRSRIEREDRPAGAGRALESRSGEEWRGSCNQGCRQIRDDEFRHAQQLQKVLARKGSEHRGEKREGKNAKERTKKEPADEEFSGKVGISGEAKKQSRESQEVGSKNKPAKKNFVDHRVQGKSKTATEKKKDGEMTDTGRPAQRPPDIALSCRPCTS